MSIKFWAKILFRIIDVAIIFTCCTILVYYLTGGFRYVFIDPLSVHNIFRPLVILGILFGLRILLKYGLNITVENELFENPTNLLIIMVLFYVMFAIPVMLNRYYTFRFDNLQELLLPKAGFCWFANLFSDRLIIITGQIIAIVLGSMPIYLMAKRILRNNWWALGVACIYLFYPLTNGLRFFEFRWDYFVTLIVLFGFYFLIIEKILYSMLFFLIGFINYINNPSVVVESAWNNSLIVPLIFFLFIYTIKFLLQVAQRYKWFLPWVRLGCIYIPLLLGIVNYNKHIIIPLKKEKLYEKYKPDIYTKFN